MNTQPASTTALADALQGLRDYHLPEAVSWWPLAPGWWMLLTFAVLILAVFAWWLLRQHRRRAAARQAIRELTVLRTALKQQRDDAAFLRGVSKLLRRYVLAVCPRQAATLTGEEWLAFLDARGGAGRFSNGPGRHLVDAPYRRTAEIAVDDIAELVHDWIRCNRGATP